MPAPYDPTRQTYSNDLGRSDWDRQHDCYHSRGGHDGHDLLEPGEKCKACGWSPPAELVRACQACGLTDPGPVFCRWCNALLED